MTTEQASDAERQAAEAPGATEPAGQPTSDAGQVQENPELEQLRQELAGLKAQNEELAGFRREFSWGKQTGAYDWLKDQHDQFSNPDEFKARFQTMQDAEKSLQELGDLDAVKAKVTGYDSLDDGSFWQTMANEPASPQPPSSPAPQPSSVGREPAPQPSMTAEQVADIVRTTMTTQSNAEALEDTKNDAAAQLARLAGLAGEDGQVAPAAASCYRGALDRAISGLTKDGFGNTRDVTPEDIGQAMAMVEQTIITPTRAAGAKLAGEQGAQPETPPTANAAGPGGQQPAKSLQEQSSEEINADIAAQAEAAFKTMPSVGPAEKPYPAHWKFSG